ncbi:hypoxanthine phosphoribosyltransferase [Caloranaerobacter azorensis]|uniref:Hypoxanthine phosphoribosyltransferase n=1 Tax=Caloranaerobacter azorensis TaxID=116090 RepID=A0A6P1YGJ2_9FIRM|nr:hypoxanthine phosphoribosyltransferase [Caloranaerobacter azorensis]QIB28062.1 hypoxanthine phosphoribosyltransferase [Caloranaerobacter azorensis]
MEQDIRQILIETDELQKRIKELGQEITRDYKDKDLVVICVLKGAVMFMSDLCKNIDLPLSIDFMAVSSYGSSTQSSGVVRILKDLDSSIEDRDVLIVEDIIDTGLTLSYLVENLKSRGPKSVKLCTLLNKPERRKTDVKVDYIGFTIPDEFVVGYGLDFNEKYRNLPYICILKEEVYK